jgi:hypothetical protein
VRVLFISDKIISPNHTIMILYHSNYLLESSCAAVLLDTQQKLLDGSSRR